MNTSKMVMCVMVMGLLGVGAQSDEIVLSWSSNGVLMAEGMVPRSVCTLEWASSLQAGFTNNPAPFEGLMTDSNGMIQVEIPMFFRMRGLPAGYVPEGMVLIPAGTNSVSDSDFGDYALVVSNALFVDATEVTKAQWDAVYNWAVGNGYSFGQMGFGKETNHPVHTVNWYDCIKWCNARSDMIGKTPFYMVDSSIYKTGETDPDYNLEANGFRLPTSDEWEYASRGGLSNQRFPWGDTINHDDANYTANGFAFSYDTSSYTNYTPHPDYDDGGRPYTSPVGEFAANGYGLYDMSGNLWEWCGDWYPGQVGTKRVIRGSSWEEYAGYARCGFVSQYSPDLSFETLGFRAVIPAE